MRVIFNTSVCKLGEPCVRKKGELCCMDSATVADLVKGTSYEVVKSITENGDLYYHLDGWGSLLFKANCFTVITKAKS